MKEKGLFLLLSSLLSSIFCEYSDSIEYFRKKIDCNFTIFDYFMFVI